jgi:hypothetical protein
MKWTENPNTIESILANGNQKARQTINGASRHTQATNTRTDSTMTSAERRQAYIDSLTGQSDIKTETSRERYAAYVQRLGAK